MVPTLRNLIYENRLENLGLLTLKERKERDLIAVYRMIEETETINRNKTLVWDARETTGQGKKLMKTKCLRSR